MCFTSDEVAEEDDLFSRFRVFGVLEEIIVGPSWIGNAVDITALRTPAFVELLQKCLVCNDIGNLLQMLDKAIMLRTCERMDIRTILLEMRWDDFE